ncbi:MAG: hypothetical protein R2703_13670 [Micropruina glycogenica]
MGFDHRGGGASGAGKTTLAKVIAGFIPQVEGGELTGSATVDGRNLAELSLVEAVSKVGLVIQNPFNQISGARYTVRGEIAFGLENLGTPRRDGRRGRRGRGPCCASPTCSTARPARCRAGRCSWSRSRRACWCCAPPCW